MPRFPMGGDYASPSEFRSKLFMKNLPVRVISPTSTVVTGENNPPALIFALDASSIEISTLRCFVPGQPDCLIRPTGEDGLYEAKALRPIAGRRSKYTLTASDGLGKTWYWFSQLWVAPH